MGGQPKHIRDRSRERRRRRCQICDTEFFVKNVSVKGVACSKECLSEFRSRLKRGKKQSPEIIAKRMESIAKWRRENPEADAARQAKCADALRAYTQTPEFAQASSERMKRRHQDPDWAAERDVRSSRTMKNNWQKYRRQYEKMALERYSKMADEGSGICSDSAKANKKTATKWIMQQAQDALHTETDYDEMFASIQAQLRRETPFEGDRSGADYVEYCREIGLATANHPDLRHLADSFMSDAIPKYAAEWNSRKKDG